MKIIGLTGSIASGKNFVADIFKKNNSLIFDADKIIHNLIKNDQGVVNEIRKIAPNCYINHAINRSLLGNIVFNNPPKLLELEEILHPKLKLEYNKFSKLSHRLKKRFLVLNIPLLFEKNNYHYDYSISVISTNISQKYRFIQRSLDQQNNYENKINLKNNLEKKFYNIKSKQIDNYLRIAKSDFVIFNYSRADTIRQTLKIINKI